MTLLLAYWKQIACVIVVLTILAFSYGLGRSHESAEWELKLLEQQQAYDAVYLEARQALDALEIETNARVMAAEALSAARSRKTEIDIREVKVWRTKYAANPDAGKCDLPAGFVLAHDAAATNRVPKDSTAPGADTAGASGITDVELEPVIADNYALYHRCRDVLSEWNAWYKAVQP